MRAWRTLCMIGAAVLPAQLLQAAVYSAPMDVSRWEVQQSPLHCRMEHTIPVFGRAVFSRPSGGRLSLVLESWNRTLKKGAAELRVVAPAWRAPYLRSRLGNTATALGKVQVSDAARSIRLDASMSNRLLAELEKGWQPAFVRPAWYAGGEEVQVHLSSANFANGYRDWMRCMAQLLPVNFDQIERSVLLYGSDAWRLGAENRARLDLIVRYVKADPKVARIYVDGHSDSLGRRLHNRELSKQRANVVTAYLIEQGLAEEIITTRYHGERFPVANNRTKAGRDRNRRATVRLELADPAAQFAARPLDAGEEEASRFTGPSKDPRD